MGSILRLKITRTLSLVVLFLMSLWVLWPFAGALALGAVLAISFAPIQEKITLKTRMPRSLVATFLVFLTALTVILPLGVVGYELWMKISSGRPETGFVLVNKISNLVVVTAQKISAVTGLPVSAQDIRAHMDSYADQLFAYLSSAVANIPVVTIQALVALGILWYMLVRIGPNMVFSGERRNLPPHWWKFLKIIQQMSQSVLFATILVGFLQAGLIALGAYLLTEFSAAMVFTVTLFFSFIPVIGAAPIGGLLALYQYFNGFETAAFLLVGLSLFVGVVDNFARALIAARVSHSSPGINFLGVVGGVIVWGLPGLILGPIVLSVGTYYFMNRLGVARAAQTDVKTRSANSPAPKPPARVVTDPWGFEAAR